jgi:hypothetical protein
VPENSRPVPLQEVFARQKNSAQAQILRLSQEWNTRAGQLVEDHLSQLIEQVEARVAIELDEAVTAAGYKSRRAASEEFNQLLRRLRQCQTAEGIAAWLVDSTPPFCGQAALFEVIGTRVRGVRSRGFAIAEQSFEELETPLDEAPAFAHSVQERDTVVAIGSPAEVSARVIATLAHAPAEKVHLFPIVIEEKAVAILYATAGGMQAVNGAALEWLTQAAAYAVQILSPSVSEAARPAAQPELISIDGVDMRKRTGGTGAILRQALEARARWFARTEVARMRLFQRTALDQGRMQRDIYSRLKPQIDAAQRRYRQDFLAVSPPIADYLHRELLSLAQDDASLLGPEYPGSLV